MTSENYKNNLNEPPEFGELTFSFSFEPVSLQSSAVKRAFVIAEIRKVTTTLGYLLSGDVKVDIQWLVHEQERYESGNAPDMDNIIKPILDGLSGPAGVIIDDCQVQTISSHWIDWTKREHQINISIQYIADDYVTKNNLLFVNMGANLFMPFHSDLPWEAKEILVSHLEQQMRLRNEFIGQGGDYYSAKYFMSVQRVFHKSRVYDKYPCMELYDFKAIIEKEKTTREESKS